MDSDEFKSTLQELIDSGVVGRWWCGPCDDWVPYRTELARDVIDGGGESGQAYGEDASREAHNTRHASAPSGRCRCDEFPGGYCPIHGSPA